MTVGCFTPRVARPGRAKRIPTSPAYIGFGKRNVTQTGVLAGIAATSTIDVDQEMHVAKAGINYRFGSAAIVAAAHAPSAPPGYWSGPYIGAHVGYGRAEKDWPVTLLTPAANYDAEDYLAGGQIGFNIQNGAFVAGVEAEWSATNMRGSQIITSFGGFFVQEFTSRINWMGMVAGRLGLAANNILIYGKGGVAWVHEDHAFNTLAPIPLLLSGDDLRTGWLAGGGIEVGFAPNWSVKGEYNYIDFGNDAVTLSGGVSPTMLFAVSRLDQIMHLVKLGVNYRFFLPALQVRS
jgi:opacity protein-like surface antigen